MCWLELETKAYVKVCKDYTIMVSIVSYSRPSLMIFALVSQFHIYLDTILNVKVIVDRHFQPEEAFSLITDLRVDLRLQLYSPS